VTEAVFGKAVRFTGASTQHIILRVDGKLDIDTKSGIYTANVHIKLFDKQGRLLTILEGESVLSSSFIMDEDAIYNTYATALTTALKKAFERESPFAKELSSVGKAQPYKPGKDADIGELLDKSAAGTGFFINDQGELVTNHHVVKNCTQLFSQVGKTYARAELRVEDPEKDLAVLKTPDVTNTKFASFAKDPQVQIGQTIVTLGYPLQGLLTSSPTLSTGIVSALAGPHDIKELFQHSAPVQPGNSGGPVIDEHGKVVGIVVGSLSTIMLARATGAIPQNLNFAIQGGVVQQFLTAHKVKYVTRKDKPKPLGATELASQASSYTVQVLCLQ
jgi:S1-C subfamily serine protease